VIFAALTNRKLLGSKVTSVGAVLHTLLTIDIGIFFLPTKFGGEILLWLQLTEMEPQKASDSEHSTFADTWFGNSAQLTIYSKRVWCWHVVFECIIRIVLIKILLCLPCRIYLGDCNGFRALGKMRNLWRLCNWVAFQNSFCIGIATLAQPMAMEFETVLFVCQTNDSLRCSVCWCINYTLHI